MHLLLKFLRELQLLLLNEVLLNFEYLLGVQCKLFLEIADQVMESFPVCFFGKHKADPLFFVVLNSSESRREFRLELKVIWQFKFKDGLVHFVEELQVDYGWQINLLLHEVLVHKRKVLQLSNKPRVGPATRLVTLIL